MGRELDILEKPGWFLREEKYGDYNSSYPIYYRHAITYSITKSMLKANFQNKGKNWIEKQIEDIIDAIENNEEYLEKDFIEVYPLKNNKGYVLVDQTDSYFPLIIYSENCNRDGKTERVRALKKSLKDIIDGLDDVYKKISQLNQISGWTEDFQRELYELYPTNKKVFDLLK